MHFDNVYWDKASLDDASKTPSILAIGDSWFWYPFPGGSLLNALGPLVKNMQHTILAFGNNGAEAFDYVNGVYKDNIELGLSFYGSGLSAIFISGGGNDFAGFNDLRPLLKLNCSSMSTARGCFRTGSDLGTIQWLMDRTQASLDSLIVKAFSAMPANSKVFLHNYDYPFPSGKGVFGGKSDWLRPGLVDAQVPSILQRPCVKYIIDQYTTRIKALESKFPERVVVVDSRNTLAASEWANEIHPTQAGFKKIAAECWLPVLSAEGLA